MKIKVDENDADDTNDKENSIPDELGELLNSFDTESEDENFEGFD